jgi:hypothetical protein
MTNSLTSQRPSYFLGMTVTATRRRSAPSRRDVATINAHANAAQARHALDARLSQLEEQHAEFVKTLVAAERAVAWLAPTNRVRARRRLQRLGLTEQSGSMDNLCEFMETP